MPSNISEPSNLPKSTVTFSKVMPDTVSALKVYKYVSMRCPVAVIEVP